MSNLSELLPAGSGAKVAEFVASGTLASGQTVVLKTDGKVEAVGETAVSGAVGASSQPGAGDIASTAVAYDSTNNKILVAYSDYTASQNGRAVVGTVSGTSITFGTPVQFSGPTLGDANRRIGICFNSTEGKFVIAYRDSSINNNGRAITATISGTSVSFGSSAVFTTDVTNYQACSYDSTSNKVVIVYSNDSDGGDGYGVVATISGTSLSFGTPVEFESGYTYFPVPVYDSNANKTVIVYRDGGNSNYGTAIVATVSSTAISYGSPVVFEAAQTEMQTAAFDSVNNKIVVAYTDAGNSGYGTAIVGTVSGTSISFGTAIVFISQSTGATQMQAAYNVKAGKTVIGFNDNNQDGNAIDATVSGTSLSFSSPVVFESGSVSRTPAVAAYDSTNFLVVFAYRESNGGTGEAVAIRSAYTSSNNTDFVGITNAAISNSATGEVAVQGGVITNSNLFPLAYTGSVGSEVVFEAARADYSMSIFDSSNNKVVIIYADNGDSNHGKAIVGTVSGSSISYGTAVTFNAATTTRISGTFDSNSNKVVIAFGDDGDSSKVKSIVGTVSGTSISFGSEATITTNTTGVSTTTTFDSNSNKVVVFYRDDGNSEYGTAAVGTVSGTSISFGTPVVFESAGTGIVQSSSTFDTSANKTVVAYRDVGNSSNGTAIVGTVSGTSISFGTAVVFHAASTEEALCAFDSVNNKVVVAYRDNAAPKALASRVGTISGTSISFGTEATVQSITSYIAYPAMSYSPDSQRVVIVYTNADNSSYGTYALGSVSGTDITYDTPVVFAAASTEDCGIAYDTNADKFVVSFKDTANSNHGTSVVLTLTGTVPALTIGSDYYVQDDGSLSTTTSTVPAGRALSATSILLEG
tara:strand:- start:150 stop:2747 length:2598 start_codon:yes stop_codon:yes gene_type:complete